MFLSHFNVLGIDTIVDLVSIPMSSEVVNEHVSGSAGDRPWARANG